MFYDGYHFFGMHLIWWFVWLIVFVWIFASPYNIPGQRKKKKSPLDILQKRLASGQITIDEYRETKKILENDLVLNSFKQQRMVYSGLGADRAARADYSRYKIPSLK